MCYNDYPTWPKYISYSSNQPITNISITTQSSTSTDDDSANSLGIFLAIFIALLF